MFQLFIQAEICIYKSNFPKCPHCHPPTRQVIDPLMYSTFVTFQTTRLQPGEVQPSQLLQSATVNSFIFRANFALIKSAMEGLIIDLLPRIALMQ